MGKGMSSGYSPLAGVAIRDHVAAAFWGDDEAQVEFSHGQTYGGNPLSSAAGVATIRELMERDLPARGQELGDHLRARIAELEPLGVIGDVRGKGLLIGMEFVRDRATRASFGPGVNIGLRIGLKAIDKGLISRFDPHWIALAPPLTSTVAEVDQMFDIFAESLRETLAEL
jgi:adenosylmethionine-8-amino-7-oxononanoate aminotransferase